MDITAPFRCFQLISGKSCYNSLIYRLDVSSQSILQGGIILIQVSNDVDSISISGRILAIEVTLYDEETMDLDGIHCSYPAGISFPAPLS